MRNGHYRRDVVISAVIQIFRSVNPGRINARSEIYRGKIQNNVKRRKIRAERFAHFRNFLLLAVSDNFRYLVGNAVTHKNRTVESRV